MIDRVLTAWKSGKIVGLKLPYGRSINYDEESKKYELVIEDQDIGMNKKYFWLASTYQLKNSLKNNYQATFPERSFSIEQISSIIKADASLNKWRELRFQDGPFYSFGKIRKIIISPKKSIEFSIKGRVLLDELNKTL